MILEECWFYNEVAHYMLTPEIENDLHNLRGFKFNFDEKENFPKWRIEALENLLQKQIDNILHERRLYIPYKQRSDN